jgi:hypothetical protein
VQCDVGVGGWIGRIGGASLASPNAVKRRKVAASNRHMGKRVVVAGVYYYNFQNDLCGCGRPVDGWMIGLSKVLSIRWTCEVNIQLSSGTGMIL